MLSVTRKNSTSCLSRCREPYCSRNSVLSSGRLCSVHILLSFLEKFRRQVLLLFRDTQAYVSYLERKYSEVILTRAFIKELRSLRLSYNESELKQFFKVYGATTRGGLKGVSVGGLIKCLQSELAVRRRGTRTTQFKTRKFLSSSFSTEETTNLLESSSEEKFLMGPQPEDTESFIEQILAIFSDAWDASEYFFVERGSQLTYEEFWSSCEALGIAEIFPIEEVYESIGVLKKEKFVKALEREKEEESSEDIFREKVKSKYANVLEAFEFLTDKAPKVSLKTFSIRLKLFGIKVDQKTLKQIFDKKNVVFSSFKKFWTEKTNFCAVKSCEKDLKTNSQYCFNHSESLIQRALSFLANIQKYMPSSQSKRIYNNLIKNLQEHPNSLSIKKQLDNMVPGQIYSRKDIIAIQEYLKQPQPEPRRSFSPEAPKHSELYSPKSTHFSFSRSPIRRIVRLKNLEEEMKSSKKKFYTIGEVKKMITRLKTRALKKSLTVAFQGETVKRLKKLIRLCNSFCIVFLEYGKVDESSFLLEIAVEADNALLEYGSIADKLWEERLLVLNNLAFLYNRTNELKNSMTYLFECQKQLITMKEAGVAENNDLVLISNFLSFIVLWKISRLREASGYLETSAAIIKRVYSGQLVSKMDRSSIKNIYGLLIMSTAAMTVKREKNIEKAIKLCENALEQLKDERLSVISLIQGLIEVLNKQDNESVASILSNSSDPFSNGLPLPEIPEIHTSISIKDWLCTSEFETIFFVCLYVPFIDDKTPIIRESELISNVEVRVPEISRKFKESSHSRASTRISRPALQETSVSLPPIESFPKKSETRQSRRMPFEVDYFESVL